MISSHVVDRGGFAWDKKVAEYRKIEKQYPFSFLHLYNLEAFTYLFIAFFQLFNGIYNNLGKLIVDLFHDLYNNLFQTDFNNLRRFILELFFRRFGQLNPNPTDYFWLIFCAFTLTY